MNIHMLGQLIQWVAVDKSATTPRGTTRRCVRSRPSAPRADRRAARAGSSRTAGPGPACGRWPQQRESRRRPCTRATAARRGWLSLVDAPTRGRRERLLERAAAGQRRPGGPAGGAGRLRPPAVRARRRRAAGDHRGPPPGARPRRGVRRGPQSWRAGTARLFARWPASAWRRGMGMPRALDIYAVLCSIETYDVATRERGWSPARVERWWQQTLVELLLA